jgi:hypothetical protein
MTSKLSIELDLSVRNKITWSLLPIHIKNVRNLLFLFVLQFAQITLMIHPK